MAPQMPSLSHLLRAWPIMAAGSGIRMVMAESYTPMFTNPREAPFTIPRRPVAFSQQTSIYKASHVFSQQARSSLERPSIAPSFDPPPRKPTTRKRKSGLRGIRHSFLYSWCSGWAPETASFILAFLLFGAIVLLLALRSNQPLPDWPSLLGINSLLAILVSLFKVALLYPVTQRLSERKWLWFAASHPASDLDRFDAATRSPWGALFLFAQPAITFATRLGAWIIILALAIDPFTQQVLQFYTCPLPLSNGVATVQRTNNYTIGENNFVDDTGSWLTSQMTASIYQGLLDPPANSSVTASAYCISGNCTFPETNGVAFSSLGICSSVEDISSAVNGNYTIGTTPWDAEFWSWQYSLPEPNNLTVTYNASGNATDHQNLAMSTMRVARLTSTSVFTLEILMATINCTSASQVQHDGSGCVIRPRAFNVSLTPCIIAYGNVNYSNSLYQEEVLYSQTMNFTGAAYSSAANASFVPNVDCTPSAQPLGKKTYFASTVLNVSSHTTTVCMESELNSCPTNDSTVLYYDPSCIFSLGIEPAGGITDALAEMFGSSTNGPNNYSLAEGIFKQGYGDTWLANLWANGTADLDSVSAAMQSLATAMTGAIRKQGDASNSQPASGIVIESQTCVGVTWAWLALPVLLMILSGAFFGTTVAQSRRQSTGIVTNGRREPWKSSAMPLLWCGLSDETRMKHRVRDLSEMNEQGEETTIRLRKRNGADRMFFGGNESKEGGWLLDCDRELHSSDTMEWT